MSCRICGSDLHEATTASCPDQVRYVPQDRVVEEFTNPDAPKVERQILEVLKEIKAELDKIRKMLATKIQPPW